ncbi:cell division control protein 45 [Moesziomyces antarcticus]|uniref:Cell division control protein 45 n=2 Tax=Pseudozyma antarctica TaxID=84753 RepID=A0A081CJV7_PSEA2|nr:cell division control protein 45 [Moesziomyces antarcticus]GAK66953.1 cell division control protein 45 [Moesziomyces antarcticus]SPO48005.1 probable TSD2 protein, required for DNA replication [Moesziomyces antarcticus]
MVVVACPNSSLVDVHIDPDRIASTSKHDYASAYARIRAAARSAGSGVSSVLVLASPDVDAVCATRMLASLFLQDDIPHRIVPVDGYRSLTTTLADVFPPLTDDEADAANVASTSTAAAATTTDVRSVVLINLGAVLSLPTMFNIPPSCTLHVIDSHRPWNLDNLFATSHANDRVWCWDDGDIATKLCRQGGERDAFEKLEFDIDSDDDDDDDSGDESGSDASGSDSDAPGEAGKRKRSSRSRSRSASADAGSDADSPNAARKRRRHRSHRPASARLTNAERHRYRTVLTRYYNRGESYGMSTSSMLYLLCESLGRADRESLWLAIVGLTSLYLSNSIDFETYEAYSSAYASEVIAIEPSTSHARLEAWSTDLLAKDDSASSTPRGVDRALRAGIAHNTKSEDADDRTIRIVAAELRFTLYRHWSLETAMFHTAYVAAKLGFWRERGQAKLRGLLAKMGFSLTAVRQNYTHMPLDLRRSLAVKLDAIAPEYGLTELSYRGFERSYGFQTAPLGAADVVEGVSALLVAAHGVKIEVETPGMVFASASAGTPLSTSYAANRGGGAATSELFATKRAWNLGTHLTDAVTAATAATSTTAREATGANSGLDLEPVSSGRASGDELALLEQAERDVWVNNFHEAYRALDTCRATSIHLLRSSLLLSQALHRRIVARGMGLITNQSIRTLKNFRLAILKDGADLELFTHVEILAQLARWLSTALRDIIVEQQANLPKRKGNPYTPLPFIIAALYPAKDIFVVLGSTAAPVHGMTEANHFTAAFQHAAKMSGARVRHDRFQTAAIHVRKSDLAPFIEKVHLKLK